MDQIVTLLTGILVAAGIFAATLFSAAQVYRQAGRLRWAHAAAALTTIAAMAALSRGLWLAAIVLERGANRGLPLFQLLFGLALLARLPFGG